MALRMLGLFMVMPLLALYAIHLPGSTPLLLGITMGIYGLTQACFQMPFGIFSDFYGRKLAIFLGLIIFIVGSFIAGSAHSIFPLMIGRTLQGAAAIGSTLIALLSDLTDDAHRTRAMAIIGGLIGISFSLSLVMGPLLNSWLPVPDIFYLSAILGIIAITILLTTIPSYKKTPTEKFSFTQLLSHLKQLCMQKEILWINFSAMALHTILMMNFIGIPFSLSQYGKIPPNHQWWIYLPVLLLAFTIVLKWIMLIERKKLLATSMVLSIGFILLSQLSLLFFHVSLWGIGFGLLLFFLGFNLLEAALPSAISKKIGVTHRGMAMGLYSTIQFTGIFLGGFLGGWIYSYFSITGIFILSAGVSAIWLYQSLAALKTGPGDIKLNRI